MLSGNSSWKWQVCADNSGTGPRWRTGIPAPQCCTPTEPSETVEIDFAFFLIKYRDVRSGKPEQQWLKKVVTEWATISILFLIYSRFRLKLQYFQKLPNCTEKWHQEDILYFKLTLTLYSPFNPLGLPNLLLEVFICLAFIPLHWLCNWKNSVQLHFCGLDLAARTDNTVEYCYILQFRKSLVYKGLS